MANRLTDRFYLDTSVIVAGLWSKSGASRAILELAGAGDLSIIVGVDVLGELEAVLLRKCPHLLPDLRLLLDAAEPSVAARADAVVVAAAIASSADFFVTFDRQHLLDNALLAAICPFRIGTSGDALAWWRARSEGAAGS